MNQIEFISYSIGLYFRFLDLFTIFIIKVFRTIVFIFIVISITFRPICPPAFFWCLSNSGTFTELRTTSFIETTGVACSDSVCHNRVQVLSIPVYYSPVVRIEDEDNSPKNLNDKNQQASSQKFRQLVYDFLILWLYAYSLYPFVNNFMLGKASVKSVFSFLTNSKESRPPFY